MTNEQYEHMLTRVQRFIRGWVCEGGFKHERLLELNKQCSASALDTAHPFPEWSRLVEVRALARVWADDVGVVRDTSPQQMDDSIIRTLMAVRGRLS